MVGVFRFADAVMHAGHTLAPGQAVGAIESMNLMNDVRADVGGEIIEVLIEDGAPVEYGQPLFLVQSS
jgi:oxaloacetate decarboxylase alpha subunit